MKRMSFGTPDLPLALLTLISRWDLFTDLPGCERWDLFNDAMELFRLNPATIEWNRILWIWGTRGRGLLWKAKSQMTPEELKQPPPCWLKAYQLLSIYWGLLRATDTHRGGWLADQMGLGKVCHRYSCFSSHPKHRANYRPS